MQAVPPRVVEPGDLASREHHLSSQQSEARGLGLPAEPATQLQPGTL